MKNLKISLTLILLCVIITLQAQEKPQKLYLDGYVKQLQSLYFFNDAYPDLQTLTLVDTALSDNLFHHRLNAEYILNESWSLHGGLRNRLFYGDQTRSNPLYADQIDAGSNDWIDLSTVWLNKNGFVGHSVIDRLYTQYSKDNWEIRAGRQRVNWGISTIWNPNDIFNAYSFTDFDYEERPGSDAIRARYFTGYAGSVELAVRGADKLENSTIAGRWVFNKGTYDVQIIGGYAQKDWVLGGGWAGNIKNAGFKGEASWFYHPEQDNSSFAITTNIDYAFEKGLYINGGALYNSEGQTDAAILNLFTFQLSASNLYPYKWTGFLQASYPVSPLLTAGLAAIYSPGKSHALFLNPTLGLSIAENWSLDAVGQLVFNKTDDGFTSPLQVGFLRLKFSY